MEETTAIAPVPFIKTGQALQSLRDSGYTIEAALGEVIDNSIEANANNIYISLFKKETKKGKKHIHEIGIVDDGNGMPENVLYHYPQIGYSTRYMRTDTIGKYGVGAKLAALNYAKRFDVWSRTTNNQPWQHVYLDLTEMLDNEQNETECLIGLPQEQPLPFGWTEALNDKPGTVILWSNIDRLEEGRVAVNYTELEANIEKELSRIFRYFINDGINIYVNNKKLLAYDPLFLMQNSFSDFILRDFYKNQPEKLKEHYSSLVIADEDVKVGSSSARLRVTFYPEEVTRRRYSGGDDFAKRLRLPDNEGSLSFIRKNREVSYTNVPRIFPRGVQEADRYIGIEISFNPELDTYFGVRNVKRGVEPHGELRNEIKKLLQKYLKIARDYLDEAWGKAAQSQKEKMGEHAPVIEAVKDANSTMPKGKATGPNSKSKENQILDELAEDVVGTDAQKKEEYKNKIKELPFVVESVSYPGNEFIDIKHLSNKVIIRLNTRHKFYRELWEPVKSITEKDALSISLEEAVSTCKRTIEAMTLLLIAYGKAESMEANPDDKYRDLTQYWGQFLNTLMSKVKNVM